MAIKRRTSTPFVVRPKPKRKAKVPPYNRLQDILRKRPADNIGAKLAITALRWAHKLAGTPTPSRYSLERNEDINGIATAIQANCAVCQCATNLQEEKQRVRECGHIHCPLWAFRLGNDPLHGKKSRL